MSRVCATHLIHLAPELVIVHVGKESAVWSPAFIPGVVKRISYSFLSSVQCNLKKKKHCRLEFYSLTLPVLCYSYIKFRIAVLSKYKLLGLASLPPP